MPVVDLARMMGTSRRFRSLAAQEITTQLKDKLDNCLGDAKMFLHLMEVRRLFTGMAGHE